MAAADGAVGPGQANGFGHRDAVPGPLVLTERHEHHGFGEDSLQPYAMRAEPDGGFLRLGQARQLGSEIALPHAAGGEHDERQRLGTGVTGCTRDIERFGSGLLRLVAARDHQQPVRQRAEHDRPHRMAGRCKAHRCVEIIETDAAQPTEHGRTLPEQPGGPHRVALRPGQRRRGQGHPAFILAGFHGRSNRRIQDRGPVAPDAAGRIGDPCPQLEDPLERVAVAARPASRSAPEMHAGHGLFPAGRWPVAGGK